MYEPTQRRVIDFYAELVLPFLRLTNATQARLMNQIDRGRPDAGDQLLDELRGVVPDRLAPTTIGTYWNRYWGPGLVPSHLDQDDVALPIRYLAPSMAGALLKYATGQLVDWPELTTEIPNAPTLSREPGTILLQPQVALVWRNGAESPWLGTPLMVPYLLSETIEIYSGQCLVGGGQHRVPRPEHQVAGRSAPFGLPMILMVYPAPVGGQRGPFTLFRAAPPLDGGHASRIGMHNLSIADEIAFVGATPETLEQLRASTVLDLNHAAFCEVQSVSMFTLGAGVVNAGDLNWFDACNFLVQRPMVLGSEAAESTVWSSHPPVLELDGIANQVWFGALEPSQSVADGDPSRERHAADLRGVGAGIVSMHMEPSLGGLQAPIVPPNRHYASIRIRGGSSFCHVSTTYITKAGFPVAVEADAAAHQVRLPTTSPAINQPEFPAGLLNHLTNGNFINVGAGEPGDGWRRASLNVLCTEEEAVFHAFRTSLRIRLQGARGHTTDAISQTVRPATGHLMSTLADRTFAAGLWVHADQAGVVIELRESAPSTQEPQGAMARSNPHPGGGQWSFISVVYHTGTDTRELSYVVRGPDGTSFCISEPILVNGALLPPYSARPLDAAGPLERVVVPDAGEIRDICWPCLDPDPGPRRIGRTWIEEETLLAGMLVAIGHQAQGAVLRMHLSIERDGVLERIPEELVVHAGKAGPQQARFRFVEPHRLPGGHRLTLHSLVEGPVSARPALRDVAVSLKLRRAV